MIPKPRPMSDQEAFNNVWQHFIVERNPRASSGSVEDNASSCLYRTKDNENGCAIGCQLPDVIANELLTDNHSVYGIWKKEEVRNYFEHCTQEVLGALQSAHDALMGPLTLCPTMEEALQEVAVRYRLTVPNV